MRSMSLLHTSVWVALSVALCTCAACSRGDEPPPTLARFPQVDLKSPYLGDKKPYRLPVQEKPTLVVLIEGGQSLVPMELIRALRSAEKYGDRLEVAVVFVGGTREPLQIVGAANEQRGLLEAGMHWDRRFRQLSDCDRALWSAMERPRLPQVLLIAGDGRIIRREMFLGSLSVDEQRISVLLDGTDGKIEATDDLSRVEASPIFEAVSNSPSLAASGEGDEEHELVQRVDAKAITSALAALPDDDAQQVISRYVGRATNFTLARRFALAAVGQADGKTPAWAESFLKSGLDGRVSVSSYRGEYSLDITNASKSLSMYVELRLRLTARWNGLLKAEVTRSYTLQPGSGFDASERLFRGLDFGWGDYRVDATYNITMSAGQWPDNHDNPSVKREACFYDTYIPRSEYADEKSPELEALSMSDRAFQSGLDKNINAIRREVMVSKLPATEKEQPDPVAFEPKPFAGLNIERWVQGREAAGIPESFGSVKSFSGRVLLLDFMFVRCGPCRAMLPKLTALHDRYAAKGLLVLSVAPSWGGRGLLGLIEEGHFKHAFAELSEGDEKRWEVAAYPTVFLVDKKGIVRASYVGEEPDLTLLEKLLAEEP